MKVKAILAAVLFMVAVGMTSAMAQNPEQKEKCKCECCENCACENCTDGKCCCKEQKCEDCKNCENCCDKAEGKGCADGKCHK
jgi:hypothetical protein